jgi:competence protein ComEA
MPLIRLLGAAAALAAVSASAQQLPDGPGKAETQKVCTQCHELARSVSLRQDRVGWEATVNKMVTLGAKASDADLQAVITYLAAHFPADEMPPLRVNTARQIEFESALTLRRSQAAAIIKYREEHGPFKSIEDLEKVPGIDVAKIEAKKDRLVF